MLPALLTVICQRLKDKCQNMWTVREGTRNDLPEIINLSGDLNEWFTERGVDLLGVDVNFQSQIVAVHRNFLVGFISFYVFEGIAHIAWMGVDRCRHRMGIGRTLMSHMKKEMKKHGVSKIKLLTLGEDIDYEPYARTRAFITACDFALESLVHTEIEEFPSQACFSCSIN